jgi:spore maturation protein CgeB
MRTKKLSKETLKKNKLAYINDYNKKNLVNISFRLSKENDSDIITALDQHPSKAGYIKELIRKDIAGN